MKQEVNFEGNPTKALPPIIQERLPMSRGPPTKEWIAQKRNVHWLE